MKSAWQERQLCTVSAREAASQQGVGAGPHVVELLEVVAGDRRVHMVLDVEVHVPVPEAHQTERPAKRVKQRPVPKPPSGFETLPNGFQESCQTTTRKVTTL